MTSKITIDTPHDVDVFFVSEAIAQNLIAYLMEIDPDSTEGISVKDFIGEIPKRNYD